jgi:16S rRNA (adenine1518-N6/adenine1519-N6)-dimethyltransferase
MYKDDIRQKKSLAQIFLTADWPVRRMVELLRSWDVKRTIEIGPGGGVLTFPLLEAGIHVTAIEKDERFAERIKETIGHKKLSADVIVADVLGFNLHEWLNVPTTSAVVGNIPYNISSPILLWCIPYLDRLAGAIFMTQLEFAQRISAAPDSKAYGSLSVFIQLRAHVSFEFKVERALFSPVPKVDSAVFSLRARKDQLPSHILRYTESVCRAAFSQRRKKLRNAIKPLMGLLEESDCPISLDRRAETLTPDEFVQLAKFVFQDKLKEVDA